MRSPAILRVPRVMWLHSHVTWHESYAGFAVAAWCPSCFACDWHETKAITYDIAKYLCRTISYQITAVESIPACRHTAAVTRLDTWLDTVGTHGPLQTDIEFLHHASATAYTFGYLQHFLLCRALYVWPWQTSVMSFPAAWVDARAKSEAAQLTDRLVPTDSPLFLPSHGKTGVYQQSSAGIWRHQPRTLSPTSTSYLAPTWYNLIYLIAHPPTPPPPPAATSPRP